MYLCVCACVWVCMWYSDTVHLWREGQRTASESHCLPSTLLRQGLSYCKLHLPGLRASWIFSLHLPSHHKRAGTVNWTTLLYPLFIWVPGITADYKAYMTSTFIHYAISLALLLLLSQGLPKFP